MISIVDVMEAHQGRHGCLSSPRPELELRWLTASHAKPDTEQEQWAGIDVRCVDGCPTGPTRSQGTSGGRALPTGSNWNQIKEWLAGIERLRTVVNGES